MPAKDITAERVALGRKLGIDLSRGFLLHVGVNTWYKNRTGVLAMVDRWRRSTPVGLPLLMVGPPPPDALASQRGGSHTGSWPSWRRRCPLLILNIMLLLQLLLLELLLLLLLLLHWPWHRTQWF